MSQDKTPRVIVFHPYGQHSYYLAAAVQRAGLLRYYVARVYADRTRFPFNLIRFLPKRFRSQVDELLYRRQWKDIDNQNVMMVDMWAELLFIVLNRLQLFRTWRERWFINSSSHFSRHVGRIALREADMLIGTDGASLEAFQIVGQRGIVKVLDMAHPHILSEMRVKEEEAQYAPPGERYDSNYEDDAAIQYHLDEISLADAFIVASDFSRNTLIENGIKPERIHVAAYGVEERFFQPRQGRTSTSDRTMGVLFSGIIGQRKGIRYLLEAVNQLRREGYDMKVHITGNFIDVPPAYGDYEDVYINHKRVPDTHLPRIYAAADVFVLPTLFEGFGRVILEAMAAGLPIITTPNCGGPDIITEGREGFIVPQRDVEALKVKLRYLYDNPEACNHMGQLAQDTARNYTWERYYEHIGTILSDIWYGHTVQTSNHSVLNVPSIRSSTS